MSKKTIRAEGWNYAFVPKDVFLSSELYHADVRLYCYLLWRTGRNENTWPNVDTMAKELSMSYAAVKLSLKSLIKNNWIRRERNFKGSSTTWVYEKQDDCRSANLLANVRLTGKPNDGQQVSRLKESQVKENHRTGATPTAPTLTAEDYKARVRTALTNGIARHEGFTAEIESQFAIRPNWDTKTNRSAVQNLKEQGACREQVEVFKKWYFSSDWRGKQGQPPTPPLIAELWPQAFKIEPETRNLRSIV